MGEHDPLDILFEEDAPDRELLAEYLAPNVRIYPVEEKMEIGFTDKGSQLTVREKILVYLSARKAIVLRYKDKLERESISPKDLENNTGIPGGTLRPILTKLLKERFVAKDEGNGGGYYIPNYAIKKIYKTLVEEE